MIAHQWAYALVKLRRINSFLRDVLMNTKEDNSLTLNIGGVSREVKFRAGSSYNVRAIELAAAVDEICLELEQLHKVRHGTDI